MLTCAAGAPPDVAQPALLPAPEPVWTPAPAQAHAARDASEPVPLPVMRDLHDVAPVWTPAPAQAHADAQAHAAPPQLASSTNPVATGILAHMRRHAVSNGRNTLVFYSRRYPAECTAEHLAGTPEARRCMALSMQRAESVQPCHASAVARNCALMAVRTLAVLEERVISCDEFCALLALFTKHHDTQTRIFRYKHLHSQHAKCMSNSEKEALECALLARFDWRLVFFLGPAAIAVQMLAAVYGNALPIAARRAHERHAHALFADAEALTLENAQPGLGAAELAFHALHRQMRGHRRWRRNAMRIADAYGVEPRVLTMIPSSLV